MSVGLPSESPLDSATPLSLEGAGVLIVDEDPAFQLGLKTFLKDFVGFSSVRVAGNGNEALRILTEDPSIALITLDYRMPELDGLGLLEKLREYPPRPLSVVMITGYPSERLEEEFYSFHTQMLRTEHFIAKPVDFEALEPVVLKAYESLRIGPPEMESPVPVPALMAAVPGTPALSWGQNPSDPDPFLADPSVEWQQIEAFLNTRIDGLERQLDELEATLCGLNQKVPSLMTRFWIAVLALIFALALAFLAFQMDWFAQAADWIDRTLLLNRKGWPA